MAKRKRRENRMPETLHKEQPCNTESVNVVDGSNHNEVQEEMTVIPKEITPKINYPPIFVLKQASLKIGLVRKKRKILFGEDDEDFLLRKGKNPKDYRPDIVYHALTKILDSNLQIGAVYVETDSGLLFEVKPHVRIPRTLDRFCGVMVDLLDKSCVRAKESGEVIFRVLEGPLTRYLPEKARILGFSYSSPKIVEMEDYVCAINDDLSLVFVVGAMAEGEVPKDHTDDYLSVSNYELSTNFCLGIVCRALERKWKVGPVKP